MGAPSSYGRSIAERVTLLDAETERSLARAWQRGDASAWERFVESSLPFVVRIAHEYRRWGIPMDDLVQQGNVGLLEAARRWDPDRRVRLVTYAAYWIRASIRDYVVRNYRIVRLGTTRTERRAVRAWRRTTIETAEELVEHSGMPLSRARRLEALRSRGDLSLDRLSPDGASPLDRLPVDAPSPDDEVARSLDAGGVRAAVADALESMSARDRRIAEARLLADDPLTLEVLGNEMGITKERVRQLEARIRERLQRRLASFSPAA